MSSVLRRREFILFGGVAMAWPIAASAQPASIPVVGVLYGPSAAEWGEHIAAFRQGLEKAGFVENQNIGYQYRWADGQFDRLPSMAADLVARKVSVLLVGGAAHAIRAAIAATKSIPIVFTTASDPVSEGYVGSLNQPGRNVTGVTSLARELTPKKLELLRDLLPAATRVALLVNTKEPKGWRSDVQMAQAGARGLGFETIVFDGSTEGAIANAFTSASEQRADAVFVGSDAFIISRRAQIASLGLKYRLPIIAQARDSIAAGQLMSYGAPSRDIYRQAATYVGRILKGEKPADLPVLQPTKFELVVNLKTAKALGLTIPPPLLQRADHVVE
jgi:putative ABC transport system substrate-binding protein